ncbi:probable AGX1-alanine-glyoxylate transaminase [Armillaria ostoyae]|uniref:alanine--glyoxylate transaminase n=1 Tax=Armillaria ostoyae TaxID=47428 RepID=A0A284R4T6_ARMOS|nr:probable AGX1-alanine-glyoxylate transaminase [Armillaria ostoyae]
MLLPYLTLAYRSSFRTTISAVLPSLSRRISRRTYTMATQGFKQAPHKLLVIPGPIEVSDEVLYANAHPSMSHVSPEFVPVFGDCIRMTRFECFLPLPEVAANLIEPGEDVLVLHSGYFGDSFADCIEAYGGKATQVKAEIGAAVSQSEIEKALKAKNYKVVTFTHVDTSTGVLSDAKAIVETVRRVSPDALVVMDAVCSVASEEILMDEWDLDVVLTASQKGLGTPPGLSILIASKRAIQKFESRKTPVTSYYASWKKWLPIMKAYESGSAAYFATPPVNLIYAYHASLSQITKSKPSLPERFKLHKEVSQRIKGVAADLGIKQVPTDPAYAANGMTALYFPTGVSAADIIGPLNQKGIVVAGGLHTAIKDKYFRIGHMGVTVVDAERGDVDKVVASLQDVLKAALTK